MIGRNQSYFDRELCVDGHYIVTGYTNDQFCNDMLQVTDVKYELHRYLRQEEGFDAVFFLDSVNMLFCYDQQSMDILRGEEIPILTGSRQTAGTTDTGSDTDTQSILEKTPLGRRRRRTRAAVNGGGGPSPQRQENQNPHMQTAARAQGSEPMIRASYTPLHMGMQSILLSWQQVTSRLRFSPYRCALVLSNADSMITTVSPQEMSILEELQSYHSVNHSIVIYLFRDTNIARIEESVQDSAAGSSNSWIRIIRNILLPRIQTDEPDENRVISLRTPNALEVRNLLGYLRLRPQGRLHIRMQQISELAGELAASCARQKWGLSNLLTRLERCIHDNPDRELSLENWREYTGENTYKRPLEQLNDLIGMQEIKNGIREWYTMQQARIGRAGAQHVSSSRFRPLPETVRISGHGLNIRLKGSPGTGKTTVARLIGMLYYDLGVLPQGQLIECSAAELISQNVGGTAGLVRARVQEAMGGVLFIDEAYSLATNAHGTEAINQLVADISAYEGQFAVVLAGYPADIDRLMRENDGLARRFPVEYNLPDYEPEEMRDILLSMTAHDPDHPVLSDALREKLDDFCEAWVGGRTRGWGNAGEAQTLLTNLKKRCSARMYTEGIAGRQMVLDVADIPENLQHCLAPRSQNLQEAFREIDGLIGLRNVKHFLRRLSSDILWGVEDKVPGNYIFSGPPGTGKTTVARYMGEILGHLGILRRKVNNVIECRAADLLNGNAVLEEVVQDARGGILFIDEAHQLEQDQNGHTIIRALVPLIEDPQIHADTCFICAGYAREMKRFLEVDPGLSRRFPANHRIRFDDYRASELVQILESMAKAKGIRTDCEEFRGYLRRSRTALEKYLEHRPENFGNGGFIRDVYLPDSIAARTARLNRLVAGSDDSLVTQEMVDSLSISVRDTLTQEDIPRVFLPLAGPAGQREPEERNALALLGELYGKKKLVDFVRSRMTGESEEVFFDQAADAGMHFSIAGPAGCGKHTAIKAVVAAYRELGILERDDVLFAGKADLEAGYVGQTAIKAQEVVERAVGGTLVITYPSAMLPRNANDNSFGPEALGVIAGAMGEHFGDLCVVFLDTAEGMEDLFKALPSIRSQLARQFVLEDLLPEEMKQIFDLKTSQSMYFEKEIMDLLPDFFLNWVSDRGGLGDSVRSWGNGKEVDRLIRELQDSWKKMDGKVHETIVSQEDGTSYTLRRRWMTREMFPAEYRKYLSSSRANAETALKELEDMTGLASVKSSIRAIERRLRHMPPDKVTPGLYCYVGNPGVGKTTVASLMGGILKAAGALSQGHVITRTARQMCDNLDELESTIRLAKNGILFIDEAHQLAEPHNLAGRSVIKRLLTVLEDVEVVSHTCIILAGYPRDMARMFQPDVDSGLASRFGTANSIIRFDDYTSSELLSIMDSMAEKADKIPQIGFGTPLRLSQEYRERALAVFEAVTAQNNPDFGNARFVRNFLHDSIDELLERLDRVYGEQAEFPEEVRDFLTGDDIPRKYSELADHADRKEPAVVDRSEVSIVSSCRLDDEHSDAAVEDLSKGVVLLEVYQDGVKAGEGSGSIISTRGYVLTCAHVVKGADRIRARIYYPGMPGGDFRWFECRLTDPVPEDCDMALLHMEGYNFYNLPLRPLDEPVQNTEETILIGYPLGKMLSGGDTDSLRASHFEGRIASCQEISGISRYYIDTTGLHGNSGSPVFSKRDGRIIGVFSGSILPGGDRNLDELNYFYPVRYFWERFVR